MSNRVPVRFLKPYAVYNPGEIAGFLEEKVAFLVSVGAAERFVERSVVTKGGLLEPERPQIPLDAPSEATEPVKRKRGRPRKQS